ncbi:hypothetical protein EWB00_010536 [Schistosoma japonicum]|uniref:Uncharacterized protein n=1 Tax=Schistosoma japonicum TaxID=6182 RepID=A0A4Z2DP57_SCHJA|nr:hypothetical protein EWB00_010536 [Schistosoma japonicum]
MNISTVLLLIKLLPTTNQQDNKSNDGSVFNGDITVHYMVVIIEINNAVLVNTTTNENILWNANFNDPTTHDYKHLFHLLCALVLKWGKSVMYLGSDDGVCTEIIFSPADVQQSAETQNSHVVAKSTSAFTFPFVLAYDGHHIKNLLDAKYEEYNTHMNLKVAKYEASVRVLHPSSMYNKYDEGCVINRDSTN